MLPLTRNILGQLQRLAAERGEALPDDATLLERFVRQCDALAFEVLVWRHAAAVWAICRRVLRHQQDAEDAFQSVWVVLALKAGTIGKGGSLGPWLHRVAVRAALRARRQRARLPVRTEVEPSVTPPDACDLRGLLDAEVDRLPEKHRRAFVLCQMQGLTLEQAALVLGCPPATVGTWVARAKQRLRERLPDPSLAAPLAALPDALVPLAVRVALYGEAASPSVVLLVKGAMTAMFVEKVRWLALIVVAAGLAALVPGLVGLANASKPAPPAAKPAPAADDEAAAEKRAAKEFEDAQSARAEQTVRAKLNEIEAAHLLGRYAELLSQVNALRTSERAHRRAVLIGRDAEKRALDAESELKETENEITDVKGKLHALELSQMRLVGRGTTTTPVLGVDRATPALDKVLRRLDGIDKRLEALEKRR